MPVPPTTADEQVVCLWPLRPLVGFVRTGFDLRLDPTEVDEAFEVPLGAVSTGLIAGIPLHESNLERQHRWDSLAGGFSARVDERAIHALMSDHADRDGDKNTICRHGDELSETLWGALIDCERRELKVVFGHTCSGDYATYAIDSIAREVHAAAPPQPNFA